MDEFNPENTQNTQESNVPPAVDGASDMEDRGLGSPEPSVEPSDLIAPREPDFFAEESYYDTHPLPGAQPPPQAPPPNPHYGAYPPQPPFYPQQPYRPAGGNPPSPQGGIYPPQGGSMYPPPQGFYGAPPRPPYGAPYTPPPAPAGDGNPYKAAKKSKAPWVVAAICVLLIGLLILVIALGTAARPDFDDFSLDSGSPGTGSPNTVEIPTQNKPTLDGEDVDADGRYSTQGVAKITSPSVVGVVVYGQGQSIVPTSEGSGIILSEDGYIATNAHVIEGAAAQKVILSNEREYIAQIIGRDTKSDLAVLKITPDEDLQAAVLGNSDELELGEQVITLGNAGGFANSFSGGYVSGLNRQIKSTDTGIAMNCIQTDAAVNPGNSGGPLVNMYGQIVGIVSSKYVDTGFEGIGFAIAVNDALPIIQDIISQGYVSDRVRIGITLQGIDEWTARENNIVPGLYIESVDPTCDIARSGLQPGDIITEMNGQKVFDYQSVTEILEGKLPGDQMTARVYRKSIIGEVVEFEITFKLMEDTSIE